MRSHATNFVDLGKIFGGDWQAAGGLVGYNDQNGTVDESFATGSVLGAQNNIGTSTGGLIGWALFGTVRDSYAMGSEANANWSGGFIGISDGSNYTSYSIGAPTGRYFTGGFLGSGDVAKGANCYWDITTSKQNGGSGSGKTSGLTGLTDQQLKAGLPPGFDPKVWAQDPKINKGYPYLIDNPPPR